MDRLKALSLLSFLQITIVFTLLFIFLYNCFSFVTVYPPGDMIVKDPEQKMISPYTYDWEKYEITVLANIKMEAKVLSKKKYITGDFSDLSRYDLALGWGTMSNDAILENIDIDQHSRWYFWRINSNTRISKREVITHSSNVHTMVKSVASHKILSQINKGDLISIEGELVKLRIGNKKWISSLSREDTGGGACEIIVITSIKVINSSLATKKLTFCD